MFQQRQDESLYNTWTRFKDSLLKVPHHGLDLWLQHGKPLYEEEGWNDPIVPEEESLDYENPDLEQLLGVMECKVCMLMEKAISLIGKSESIFGMSSNMMRQLPIEPSRKEAFEDLVMNFILDQEERIKQLEEYMGVIRSDFMQLSLKVVKKLKDEIRAEENRVKKIKKITRYSKKEDLKPSSNLNLSETLAKSTSSHASDFISPKSLCVKYVRTIFPSSPLIRERIPIEVEPLHEPQLEDLRLNTCDHDIPLSSREIPSIDEPEPQLLPNFSPLDVNLGDKRGTDLPIKPYSPYSFRMK
ncbi:hypothetical protein Tco_0833353, partial [Tanacetum coccineum]